MENFICIYCLCDDFLSALNLRNDKQYRMTSAEILTVAIVSALFFNENLARTRLILKHDGYFPNMLSESLLNRRLHEIDISIWQSIFHAISKVFCKNNDSLEYLIDSMPVEVCMNVRSYRCRLLTGKQFIGYGLQGFEKIKLIADRKTNAARQHSGCVRYLQSVLRKGIETTFSQLTSMLPRKIHAVTSKRFLLKLVIFIISFSIEQVL